MKDLIRLSRILKKVNPSSINFTQNGDKYKEFNLVPFKVRVYFSHANLDWLEIEVYSGTILIDGISTPLDGSLVQGYKDYLSQEEISALSKKQLSNYALFDMVEADLFKLVKQLI